jgi:hypothetical protein
MIQIGNVLYSFAETGDLLAVGVIRNGIDSNYIEWYL